ncbi:MAG: sulfite exporter TauE/SafE family protein [Rhizobiaceae bacterium]|nr:sulfite exporter TauE/SafE family protein [Rhizobiaceae bacterium]
MSGFGAGMIIAPVAGAIYGPQWALVIVVVVDALPILPVAIPALRIATWREVTPVAIGTLLCFPLGIAILTAGDPVALRWLICAAILACVAVLWSGWRYRGPRNAAVSGAAGGVAGVLSGIAQIPGPPVIAYWMASGLPAVLVRANLLAYFLVGEAISIGNLWAAGLFERGPVMIGIAAMPFYFAGLMVGWRLFGLASDATYRRVTFLLIVVAAVLAAPVWDGLLKG